MSELKKVLNSRTDLQHLLFRRGFFVSKKAISGVDMFPFYGNWNHVEKYGYNFYVHKDNHFHFAQSEQCCVFLIGHSYNPFTMEWDENKQLQRIADSYGTESFQDKIDEITGVFAIGWINKATGDIHFEADPSGMQSFYYGIMPDGNFVLTSHPQIASDLYVLKMSDIAQKLIDYKWYPRVLGPFMPGDICQYDQLKRVVPNIVYNLSNGKIMHSRFYPLKDLLLIKNSLDYDKVIREGADILKNNMDLVVRKWIRPAISLTGGIDSQTTFAATTGNYDKIHTFSYLSSHEESIDIVAARKTAQEFKVPYRLYEIPTDSEYFQDYELKSWIFAHNSGYIAFHRPNEMRKRIFLVENFEFDCEVKSWVSETIRACQYKRYRKNKMPGLSPQLYRNLYKIFITDRALAHRIDDIFKDFINKYWCDKIPNGYDASDMYFWEIAWGGWGALNISEMMVYSDITVVYNNRKFLDLLLRVPLSKRISDDSHRDMKQYLNERLYDMRIEVTNMSEDWKRASFLKLIFNLNMLFKK